jgi:ribonuclease-3
VNTLPERLGHEFQRPELLEHAMTHRSSTGPGRGHLASNERLEFLGDRVLGLCIAEWLSERYPHEREGDLGKRLAALVSRDTLAPIAENLGVPSALRIPPAEHRTGLRERANVLADALEAVLGAMYLDGGLDAVRQLVRREWAPLMDSTPAPPMSPKTRLQELTLGRGAGLPIYESLSTTGPAHAPIFEVRVTALGRSADGMGESKRAAETAAAENWLNDT